MYLSDKQRVELALPPCIMMGVVIAGVDESDPDFARACELLKTAAVEPVSDLPARHAKKILERVKRVHRDAMEPYSSDGEDVAKFGLIVFYWIKTMVESGYFVFAEGSAIDQALALYIEAIEHKAAVPKVDASAQKQARKFIAGLQGLGLYRGLVA